ncbi:hypothetical protein B0T22DRAFT_483178 [Podospora appendiculata]|uniref:Uncharacterized protein n=1 Tax=Podospora appendiculata TaxID=314037 RepID=A0AAE0X226_9PEZI|nr:hypothetical protein B0T22DRAFT_483178 [Podospora appendiculata]
MADAAGPSHESMEQSYGSEAPSPERQPLDPAALRPSAAERRNLSTQVRHASGAVISKHLSDMLGDFENRGRARSLSPVRTTGSRRQAPSQPDDSDVSASFQLPASAIPSFKLPVTPLPSHFPIVLGATGGNESTAAPSSVADPNTAMVTHNNPSLPEEFRASFKQFTGSSPLKKPVPPAPASATDQSTNFSIDLSQAPATMSAPVSAPPPPPAPAPSGSPDNRRSRTISAQPGSSSAQLFMTDGNGHRHLITSPSGRPIRPRSYGNSLMNSKLDMDYLEKLLAYNEHQQGAQNLTLDTKLTALDAALAKQSDKLSKLVEDHYDDVIRLDDKLHESSKKISALQTSCVDIENGIHTHMGSLREMLAKTSDQVTKGQQRSDQILNTLLKLQKTSEADNKARDERMSTFREETNDILEKLVEQANQSTVRDGQRQGEVTALQAKLKEFIDATKRKDDAATGDDRRDEDRTRDKDRKSEEKSKDKDKDKDRRDYRDRDRDRRRDDRKDRAYVAGDGDDRDDADEYDYDDDESSYGYSDQSEADIACIILERHLTCHRCQKTFSSPHLKREHVKDCSPFKAALAEGIRPAPPNHPSRRTCGYCPQAVRLAQPPLQSPEDFEPESGDDSASVNTDEVLFVLEEAPNGIFLQRLNHTVVNRKGRVKGVHKKMLNLSEWATFDIFLVGSKGNSPTLMKVNKSAWVVDSLEPNMLLGNDFLHPYQANIDYSKDAVSFGRMDGFEVRFEVLARAKPCNRRVTTERKITLLPGEHCFIAVDYKPLPSDRSFTFESKHDAALNAIVDAKTPKVAAVKNTTNGTIVIPKGTKVGSIQEETSAGFLNSSWSKAAKAMCVAAAATTIALCGKPASESTNRPAPTSLDLQGILQGTSIAREFNMTEAVKGIAGGAIDLTSPDLSTSDNLVVPTSDTPLTDQIFNLTQAPTPSLDPVILPDHPDLKNSTLPIKNASLPSLTTSTSTDADLETNDEALDDLANLPEAKDKQSPLGLKMSSDLKEITTSEGVHIYAEDKRWADDLEKVV